MFRHPTRSTAALLAALACGFAACVLTGARPAGADIIPLADTLRGIEMTQAQCAATPGTVWVTALRRSFCIRYYLSEEGGTGRYPVVYLSGDKMGRFNAQTGSFEGNANDKDVDTDRLHDIARRISRMSGTPAIYLARPGIDGSSGFHGDRRSVLELEAIDAALEVIKQRHGFAGFHFAGQSGGSTIVGGLLALRQDVGCAVLGSGKLAMLRAPRALQDATLRQFDVSSAIPQIVQNRPFRVIVLTDPADEKVAEKHQTTFARQLRSAGGRAEQMFVQATDEKHHGVARYSHIAVAECIQNAPSQDISRKLAEAGERFRRAQETRNERLSDAARR